MGWVLSWLISLEQARAAINETNPSENRVPYDLILKHTKMNYLEILGSLTLGIALMFFYEWYKKGKRFDKEENFAEGMFGFVCCAIIIAVGVFLKHHPVFGFFSLVGIGLIVKKGAELVNRKMS